MIRKCTERHHEKKKIIQHGHFSNHLRRRIAGKLPHHGVEGQGEQEAEKGHPEHPEDHCGAERG
jgi:hypothetical protein